MCKSFLKEAGFLNRGKSDIFFTCIQKYNFRIKVSKSFSEIRKKQRALDKISYIIWQYTVLYYYEWIKKQSIYFFSIFFWTILQLFLHLHYSFLKPRVCVKFIYSEKATKTYEIFPLLLTTVHTVKSKGKISQNFYFWGLLRIYELY